MSARLSRRLGWMMVPLAVIAWMAAPEWPARVAMMNSPWRESWLPIATAWAQTHPVPAPAIVPIQAVPTAVTAQALTPAASASTANMMASDPKPASAVTETRSASTLSPVSATATATSAPATPVTPTGGVVLMLGDSLMGEVAAGLRQHLPRTFTVVDDHKVSTGLTNLGYYDWPTTAYEETQASKPQWVVIHMGANDAQDMLLNGRAVRFGSDPWKQAYLTRATLMLTRIKQAAPNATIVWVGLPAMRSDAFDARMAIIRTIQGQAAASQGVPYLDGHLALGTAYAKDGDVGKGRRLILRADDGIHYSRAGGTLLAHEAADTSVLAFPWSTP
jgi:uncharacterized protein